MIRRVFGSVIVASLLAPLAISAQVELTANAGYLSQYYYRGLPIKNSAANGGLDVAAGTFSAGTWGADVGDGAEVDLYAALSFDLTDQVSLSVGGTGYFYTNEYDQTYLEANIGVGLGPISIDYAGGTYRTDPDATDYSFLSITGEANGLFATIGTSAYASAPGASFSDTLGDLFDPDLGLQYLEAGYGFSAVDLDLSFSGIWDDSVLSLQGEDELTFVFSVSKTFDIPLD